VRRLRSIRRATASAFSSLHVPGCMWPAHRLFRGLVSPLKTAKTACKRVCFVLTGRLRRFLGFPHKLGATLRTSTSKLVQARGLKNTSGKSLEAKRKVLTYLAHEAGWEEPLAESTGEGQALQAGQTDYRALVKAAEKDLRELTRTHEKRFEAATHRLDKAEKLGGRRLGGQSGVVVFEDRIQTTDGVARFADGPVEATVRAALWAREPQLMVDTARFVSVVRCKPGTTRKFAEMINRAASSAPHIAAERAHAIAVALAELQRVQLERDEQLRAAELQLEAVRANDK
jgi:hypothetical protein